MVKYVHKILPLGECTHTYDKKYPPPLPFMWGIERGSGSLLEVPSQCKDQLEEAIFEGAPSKTYQHENRTRSPTASGGEIKGSP